ncbi:fructose-6-phosphate aldolase [candidate division CSSED10-310 bacterium]|uniref:Probable transaldolase n=1 Tax=candidate division CSSED10-310 bacterium TaxID=2855610 RepID=A0ABV6Z5I8_UNCC1
MKFFIDTADIEEIRKAKAMGMVDGVTTNPSLIAKTGQDFDTCLKEIVATVDGPISAEVLGTDSETMVAEAKKLVMYGENVNVKIPMTVPGMVAVKKLTDLGIKTNVTLVFSPNQAILAAKAGASFVSPFVGRLDDIGHVGMDLVDEILQIFDNYAFTTEVIVASIRNPIHVKEAALMGAHISTIPFKVIQQLAKHPLTDIGIKRFEEDWQKVPT